MSLSVIPLTILGQITGVSGSGDTVLYQVSFKSIDGTPLYGVTAVWTDEQAEIEALAAQKPYGVWINPISGEFTVKFAGYTYVGSADLTDDDVLSGVTPIEFITTEVSDRLLPEEPLVLKTFPAELQQFLMTNLQTKLSSVISADGKSVIIYLSWKRASVTNIEDFDSYCNNIAQIASSDKRIHAYSEDGGLSIICRNVRESDNVTYYDISLPGHILDAGSYTLNVRYDSITFKKTDNAENNIIYFRILAALLTRAE